MTIANLFANIGIKTDETKVKSYSNALHGVKNSFLVLAGAAGVVSAALNKVMGDAFKSSTAFKQFETETGASAQQLQMWGSVAEQTGNTADSVANSIKSITDNQAQLKLGGGNISGYQLLGIDPSQDPFKILEQFRDKTAHLSASSRKNIASMMGIDPGLLQTLEMSSEKFAEMAGHGFIVSPSAIKTLNDTKASLTVVGRAFTWLKTQIAVELSPQIKKMQTQLLQFIKVHKEAFVTGFKRALAFVSRFVTMISRGVSVLDRMISSTIGWKNAIIGVLGIFTAVKGLALLSSPLGMIVAGFVALFVVLEDLYVYSKGGKSLFGEFEKSFPKIAAVMKGAFDGIQVVFDLLTAIVAGDKLAIDKILADWGVFGDLVNGVLVSIQAVGKALDFGMEGVKGMGLMSSNISQGLPLLSRFLVGKEGNYARPAETEMWKRAEAEQRSVYQSNFSELNAQFNITGDMTKQEVFQAAVEKAFNEALSKHYGKVIE